MRVYPLWLIVDGHMSNKKIGERASAVMMDTQTDCKKGICHALSVRVV